MSKQLFSYGISFKFYVCVYSEKCFFVIATLRNERVSNFNIQSIKQDIMDNHHYIPKENSRLPVLVFSATFLIFFLGLSPIRADNVISGGTTIRINSGTFVTSEQKFVVENGGGLAIEGSLILKNNFTNQNTVNDLGTGTIEFSGTTPQSLSGQNILGSLVVNNPAGLDLTGNTTINTGLDLRNGLIWLGTNNLTLGSTATITGTPSSTAMVVATGTGELRKSFSGTGAFTYPVGDDSGIAEYSPVTLNFTSGTFAADNYAGVKLTNSAYTGLTGNYLNRYWTLNQSGITSAQYNALFQYVPADIVGTETSLSSVQLEPAPAIVYNPADALLHQLTATGATTFGIFSGFSKFVQEILLNNGWNIFSSYVTPANLNLKDIFQLLIDAGKLKKVMDEAGKTIENFGAFGGWRNNIGNLNSIKGYKVNVTAASTLSIEGTPVPLPLDITLNTGWNIISYPCLTNQDAKALVQSLIDAGKLKKVMDETGKTIENFGAFGGWKNNIGNFIPGKGYKVNVAENCVLTIPATGTKSAIVLPEMMVSDHFKPVFIGNGTDHMSINLVNLQASGLVAGDEIGVFDRKLCVGSATIGTEQLMAGSISIPTSSNDELSEIVNGFSSGHPVDLQLYKAGKTYQLNSTKLSGNEWFEKNGSLFAQVNTKDLTDIQITEKSAQFKCFPNPFTSEITIEVQNLSQAEITVEIYNMTGQRIKNLFKGTNNGNLVLKWNGSNDSAQQVAPGVYLCKVNGQSKQVIFEGGKGIK